MTASMTAFARCQSSSEWGQLTWEIKTVNHRYLDISSRIPDALRSVESTLRERVGRYLARGKVECTLRYQLDHHNARSMTVNDELVDKITELARKIEIRMHESSGLSVADMLSWPGVVNEEGIDYEFLAAQSDTLLEQTLQELVASRRREGARLQEMVQQRLNAISQQVEIVRKVIPELVPAYRQRLQDRLAEIMDNLDPVRLEQELVIFANKADVSEELDRLESHVKETVHALSSDKPAGRRLDFLMQEMNREANTLGSKAADIRITNASVELKVLIEQMREQIQNIE